MRAGNTAEMTAKNGQMEQEWKIKLPLELTISAGITATSTNVEKWRQSHKLC